MRDDERYPTLVSGPEGANAPEVITTPQPDLEGRDKVVIETSPAGLIPKFDDAQKEAVVNKDAGGDIRGGEASIATTAKSRTCCGMKRRNFFIALAVLAAVLVVAIVGGVVGGLRSNSGSDDSNTDDSSSPTSTSTGAVPRKTGPIDADERCMAASIVTDDDNQNSQVFYNDLNTTDIYYRRIHDDEGTGAYTLALDIEPNWGAPMAAAAGLSSSSIETRLYYVITSDNETQIAQAVLNCGSLDADDDEDGDDDSSSTSGPCSVTSNSIISTNVTNGVHPDTRLAALRLSNDSMRIYFQAGGANIWVLHDDDDGTWTGSNLIGNVREGSSIAASAANATALHVFYVSNSTQRLRYIEYSDILGADNAEDIDESPGSGWSASAALATTYVPKFESYRLYYTNPSTGTIVSYFQNTTTPWSVNHNDKWGEPDSSIAAVAFENQVRLMYFQDSTLVMSSQDATSWDTPEEVGGEA